MNNRALALAAVLAALTIWIYAPVRHFDFVSYDDADFVTANRGITSGFTAETMRYIVREPYYATGGPLTWLSHVLDIELYGLAPRGHHLTSVAWHVVNVLLLFALLRRLTAALWPSAIVAALFAVHPLHVESVAWISQRKDMVSTCFWLLTLWTHQSYVRKPGVRRYLVVTACLIGGLLSKPIVAMAPLTMLLVDWWPLGRIHDGQPAWPQWRRLLVEKIPYAVLAVACLALTLQSQIDRGAVTETSAPVALRLGNAILSYAAYLVKMLWPADLSPFYPYRWTVSWTDVAVSLAALVLIAVVAVRVRRSLPAFLMGWGWYLATLIPVIGFVQVGAHAMADRLSYVPSIGIFIGVVWTAAWMLQRLPRLNGVLIAATLATVVVLSVTARGQVWHWQNGETLWRHAVRVDPQNGRALANLGATLAGQGRNAEALAFYRDAARLTPDEPKLLVNYGMALAAIGDRDSAIAQLERATHLDPRYSKAHLNLADQLAGRGRFDEAFGHYRTAIDLDPDNGLARMNLAVTFAETGRMSDALAAADGAIAREPRRADWRFTRAMMLKVLARPADAIRELETVLQLEPGHAEARAELTALRGK